MEKKRLGLALCGSYCTYEKLFAALLYGLANPRLPSCERINVAALERSELL